MLPEWPFNHETLDLGGELFPVDIASDQWVAYHGTSLANAERIEREGLRTDAIDAELLGAAARVVRIYEALDWLGEGSEGIGGLGVLKYWSLGSDVCGDGRRYVTFAESSCRAALYATGDFAGGEMLRAMRLSIAQLRRYYDDPTARDRHREDVRRTRERRISQNAVDVPELPNPDLPWLGDELESLAQVHARASAAVANHTGGVVYAVRFNEGDSPHLLPPSTMGLRSKAPVSVDRLVGRVLLPADLKIKWPRKDARRLEQPLNPQGVWALTERTDR